MPLAVCATPIGNLADVTLRVLEELAAADTVLCEDTRHTRVLLERHGIEARLALVPSAQRGDAARRSRAAARGRRADGARLRRGSPRRQRSRAHGSSRPRSQRGSRSRSCPGPSAVETALVASGLAGEQYRFVGYLPRGERERAALWRELAAWPHPTVAFESPKRLPATLASLAAAEPGRVVAVCRELTKAFEEVVCGPAAGARRAIPGAAEGRGDARDRAVDAAVADADAAVAAVVELVAAGAQRRAAAGVVARLTGVSRNALYGRSL